MKDRDEFKTRPLSMLPQRIRTYLYVNLALAVLMAVVMAVRTGLGSGNFLFIHIFLVIFYASVLASLTLGPFALIEVYLYRQKKGVWHAWKNQPRLPRRGLEMSPAEREHWKSEAYRKRLARAGEPVPIHHNRMRLFEPNDAGGSVSRPALLMTVADKLERSGKREAAERCYRQIAERFGDSPQAKEAGRRLSTASKV
jgi:hypothetical protein